MQLYSYKMIRTTLWAQVFVSTLFLCVWRVRNEALPGNKKKESWLSKGSEPSALKHKDVHWERPMAWWSRGQRSFLLLFHFLLCGSQKNIKYHLTLLLVYDGPAGRLKPICTITMTTTMSGLRTVHVVDIMAKYTYCLCRYTYWHYIYIMSMKMDTACCPRRRKNLTELWSCLCQSTYSLGMSMQASILSV